MNKQMKRMGLFCLFICLAITVMAQTSSMPVVPDTTGREILNELKEIHRLQQEEKSERDSIRDSLIQTRQNSNLQHEDNSKDIPSNEYGAMLRIVDNTQQDPVRDGWNLFGWITFAIALLSLIVAGVTFLAQNKTEQHTQNAPISAQIGQFKDLTRHLYRNMVCTIAAIARYNNKDNILLNSGDEDTKKEAYPSESNFNKLKSMPDDVILDIDVNENTYTALHELRVLLRNYNIEIDVASKHISNAKIWGQALEQDFDNLLFKPLHLVKSAFEPESLLLSTESGVRPLPDRSLLIILEEHFDKLKNNFNTLGKKKSQEFLAAFFGSSATDLQAASIDDAVQRVFKSMIDRTGGVRRSINNLAKLGFEEFNSVYTTKNENKYSITLDNEDLKEYLCSLDEEFVAEIDKAIKRSKRSLFWAKAARVICPCKREKMREKSQILESSISRMQKQRDNKPRKKLLEFIEGLTSVVGSDNEYEAFKSLEVVNYNETEEDYVSYDELFKSLRPYLAYMAQKGWLFEKLLYVMLAIDASIEVNRIGMVNYE